MIGKIVLVGLFAVSSLSVEARTSAEVSKDLKAKNTELVQAKKLNPGCYWNEDANAKMAMIQRMLNSEQKRYVSGKQATYVMKSYWCVKTKSHHPVDSTGCSVCKNGFDKWKKNALLVTKTEEMTASIDGIVAEIDALNQELKEAKEAEKSGSAK